MRSESKGGSFALRRGARNGDWKESRMGSRVRKKMEEDERDGGSRFVTDLA